MFRCLASLLIAIAIQSLVCAQPELTPPGPPGVPPPPNALPPNALPANALPPNALPPNALAEDPPEDEEGVETLTQGPIHEAFADPATPDPEPSPVVTEAPPADVPEQPAAYKPEGDFDWIPGYWDWDDDGDRYLWVTGVWRQSPPDMRWIPGYWNEISGGWQRVKGFWVRDEVENVVYYDQPPATLETGPSSPAPAANYFWIPGSWTYANANVASTPVIASAPVAANAGFAWQGGYWAPYQPDWVWSPARWVWTPAGFVFVPGYWDYRMGNRGQIFAPVYFRRPVYAQVGWTYRPSIVIPTGNLFIHLWVRPQQGCYYFGNYYGPRYASRGFVSWSNLPSHNHHHHYDPFYSYARVHYRQQGVDYLGRVQGWHNYYAQHPEHRSPPTFREQKAWLGTPAGRAVHGDAQFVARPIADVARKGDTPVRLAHLDQRGIESQAKHAKQIRDLDVERRKLEREHTKVSLNRPETNGRDLPGRETLGRERDKGGSLVDRVEKGDRSEKVDRVEKGDVAKGDKGGKREPGTLPRIPTAGGTAKGGETAKIALPKVEKPKTSDVATVTPENGERGRSREKTSAPPLPNAGGRPNTRGPQNTATKSPGKSAPEGGRIPDVGRLPDAGKLPKGGTGRPTPGGDVGAKLPDNDNIPKLPDVGAKLPDVGAKRPDVGTKLPDVGTRLPEAGGQRPDIGTKLPEAGKSSNRSTFGGKTGEPQRLPSSTKNNNPQGQSGKAGREGVIDVPPSGGGQQGTVRSGTVPGGRSGGDTPRRGVESPGISPEGAAPKGVAPKGNPPQGKANNQPRVTLPTASGDRARANPNSGVRETTIPNNNANNNRPPSNTNRDRGGPRNDQPTFKASAPKTESNPSGQSSRGPSREEGGTSSESGKKKGRDKQ